MIYHTFIIFITTNKGITKHNINIFIFRQELENESDPRNVEILQYNQNDPMALFKILFYKSCYFSEIGNEIDIPSIDGTTLQKINRGNHNFNFLVIWKPGTGKSTFINIMNGNKIAKEGTGGGKVTNEMCEYHVKNTNIVLYNTPGFETGGETEKMKDNLI